MLREEFFETHPNGVYNEFIARGEVVRGMDFLEVLASWGNPTKREKPSPDVEYWVYLEEYEETKDWVQYKFVFRTQGQSSTSVLTKGSGASGVGSTPKK
jgi:hypothetical protein